MTDRPDDRKPLAGRIALLTGASRGIGRAAALGLAAAGAHVVATARTRGALEELDDEIRKAGGEATLVVLDLADGEKIDQLGPTLFQRFGRLDAAVLNAGMLGPMSPLGHIRSDDWQKVLDINLTANFRLVRTLDPLLKRSDAGRVVMMTSGVARNPRAYWGPYSVSKAALEALALTYAAECETTSVKVNVVSPGPVRTRMRAEAFPGEKRETLTPPEALVPLFLELLSSGCERSGEIVDFRAWRAAASAAG
ncbi:MAG: SDR family NAD(P)-dependent oxidoreductase [Hyphomicrobiaceae bacterium]